MRERQTIWHGTVKMEVGERLDVPSRREWRRWLRANHRRKPEVWLYICRVGASPRKIALAEAVEEALCYGWIDSVMRPVDRERFILRFSPRRMGSIWAESNKKRVLELGRKGKMTRAGLAVLPPELLEACKKERRRGRLGL